MHPGVHSPRHRDVRDEDVSPDGVDAEGDFEVTEQTEPSMATESVATPPGEATETLCDSVSMGQRLIDTSLGQVLPFQPG